jgi:hypothetical protein
MGVSVPGSRIKSIQRGLITLASTDAQKSTTITAIDMTKSEIRFLGLDTSGAGAGVSFDQVFTRLWLQNSTTLWAVRNTTGPVMDVSWEITEWM